MNNPDAMDKPLTVPAVGSRDLLGQIAAAIIAALDNPPPPYCWHEWDAFAGRMIYCERATPREDIITGVLKRHWPNR